MRRLLLLPLLLLTGCRTPPPGNSEINTYLETHFWGAKEVRAGGKSLCAHRLLGRDHRHLYLWEYCANYSFLQGHLVTDAAESGPMKVILNGTGKIVNTETVLDSRDEWRILPAWIRWKEWLTFSSVSAYNHRQHDLDDEAAARMF